MPKFLKSKPESAHMIYNDKDELVALIKRDDLTKKHIVYSVQEMPSADIADLLSMDKLEIAQKDAKKIVEKK